MEKWPSQEFIIRIKFAAQESVDWHVSSPDSITFQDVLDVITQASDERIVVTSFEYEDEDGDLITVKTDEELHAMIAFHKSYNENEGIFVSDIGSSSVSQLVIYPKLAKPSTQRNIHGLKVAIAPTVSSTLLSDQSTKEKLFSKSGVATSSLGNSSQTIQDNSKYGDSFYSASKVNPSSYSHNAHSDFHQEHNRSSTSCFGMKMLKDSLSFQLGKFSNDTLMFYETLGNGNSGVVRKAIHKDSQTVTAVKSIMLDLTGEEQRRILQELEILKKCNGSPFIIAFYGAFFDENRVLLCTEFMDGGSLDQYGAIPDKVLRNIAGSIIFGLQHLWLLRIMHRDVKPSNMLVNTDGYVKLCDFGVSTQLVDSIARTYVGTNAYMAPERVIGHDYTIYSDVWSFGLSLCELATGQFPYPQLVSKIAGSRGIVPIELMQCIVNEPAPRLPKISFASDLCDFVSCCLQKEAENRWLPEQLCSHSMVTSCGQLSHPSNLILVANWIKCKMHEKLKK